jgi:septum formation protein
LNKKLVLASTSPFRRELLSKLQVPFEVASPNIDETALIGEKAAQTALRLAVEKARAIAPQFPDALIIGSDQVASLDDLHIGKPGTHEKAVEQLKLMRGKTVVFNTALALLNVANNHCQTKLVATKVRFRNLSDAEIESYLLKEKPYNCAGAAKSEGLGIAIIAAIEGPDPNALIGLPLIELITMLNNEGVRVI